MWHRVSTVFRAGFAAQWGAGVWPAAPIVSHGTVGAVLCGLASGSLPPYAYALFALAVSGALIALPFLGDFGALRGAFYHFVPTTIRIVLGVWNRRGSFSGTQCGVPARAPVAQ